MKSKAVVGMLFLGILVLALAPRQPVHGGPSATTEAFAPLEHSMLKHLAAAHDITIGARPECDILLEPGGEFVHVTLQPHFLERARNDILHVLEMNEPSETMNRVRYNQFLTMVHAFLTLAPCAG